MVVGYVPNRNPIKNHFLRLIGGPNFIRRIQAPIILRMLDLEKGETLLDAGCGGGFFTWEISHICECAGIDLEIPDSLAYASRMSSRMSVVAGNVTSLPFRSSSFDKILLSSVLQMVCDDKSLLRECNRVLKDNGIMVLSVPSDFIWIDRLNEMKARLLRKFGSRGKGFYTVNEITGLLLDERFEILEVERSPKKLGSLVYESWLYVCVRAGLPLFHPAYFFIQYPLGIIDKIANKKNNGIEILVKARRHSS